MMLYSNKMPDPKSLQFFMWPYLLRGKLGLNLFYLLLNLEKQEMRCEVIYVILSQERQELTFSAKYLIRYSQIGYSGYQIILDTLIMFQIQIEEEPALTTLANKDAFEFTAFAAKDTWTGLRKRKRQEKHKQLLEMQKKQREEEGKSKEKEKKTEEEGKPKGGSMQKEGKDAEPLTLQQQQLLEEFIAKYSSNSYFDGTTEFSLVDTSKDGKKELSKVSKDELQELGKISSKEKSYSSKTSKEEKMEVSDNNSKVGKIDLKRPFGSENGQEESSKKAKLGESVIPEPMDLSFTFSCTVAFEKQFSELENSDKKIISILCLEGNRDSFHHMFTYFQNKYECKAGISKEKKGRKSRKQKKKEKVAQLSEDKASGEEPNSQEEKMTT